MLFDLKTPWRAETCAAPVAGIRILDAEGVHILTVENTQANKSDPILLAAGLDLAAPLAGVALAAPALLQAALMILAASRAVPPGAALDTLVITGTAFGKLRSAVALAMSPVDVPSTQPAPVLRVVG